MSRSCTFAFVSVLLCPLACFRASDDEGIADEVGDSTDSEGTGETTSDTTTDTTTDTDTETTTDTETDTGPPPDTDLDGLDDGVDNCPDDPNPNQLDFDGDGQGNVCDVMVFTTISGSLASHAQFDAGLGNCDFPFGLIATGGEVQVELDDDAQLVRIELTELTIADILDKPCQLLLVTSDVSFKDFTLANGGGPFPVSTAHSQAEHDAGTAAGLTNLPHPILTTGTLEVSSNGNPPMIAPLELTDASLPPMGVEITSSGDSMTLAWSSDNFVIGTSQFMIQDPIMISVDMQLVGVDGTLTLAP